MSVRTELAAEALSNITENYNGVISNTEKFDDNVSVQTIDVLDRIGEQQLGKPKGKYVTLSAPLVLDRQIEFQLEVASLLAKKIKAMIDGVISFDPSRPTLVVGIGNRHMTADALGSKTVDKIIITRHAYKEIEKDIDAELSNVCGFAPSVLGVTGIESFETVESVASKISPQLVIAIDSLASQKVERIACTFQLTDTGITPGGGVGNRQKSLSYSSLNVPVIAIGVPLVVYAKTLGYEVLENLGGSFMEKKQIIDKTIGEILGDLVVTPKDIDQIVGDCAFIISTAINLAINPKLEIKDVISYVH